MRSSECCKAVVLDYQHHLFAPRSRPGKVFGVQGLSLERTQPVDYRNVHGMMPLSCNEPAESRDYGVGRASQVKVEGGEQH